MGQSPLKIMKYRGAWKKLAANPFGLLLLFLFWFPLSKSVGLIAIESNFSTFASQCNGNNFMVTKILLTSKINFTKR